MSNLLYLLYLKEMYIFINKRCLFKPFSYETWVCFWTMFQSFDHLPSSSSLDPPPNFSCIDQSLIPPLNNNFHVINQKKKIFLAVVIAPVLFSFYLLTLCIKRSCQFWFLSMFNICRLLFLTLKKGWMLKNTPSQILINP